ncbi:MAG: transcription antitermination factor NusB [Candidatus Thorarchaeota archaeon]|jgi:16S rRNA (cytosine967-C5)-methyltransferase
MELRNLSLRFERPHVRYDAVEALIEYDSSNASIQSIVRRLSTKLELRRDNRARMESLVLGVIRHLNTIDFLLTRSLKKGKLVSLATETRNSLRIALYEIHWIGTPLQDIMNTTSHSNGILDILQKASNIRLPDLVKRMSNEGRLSIEFSHPTFLVRTLLDNLPHDEAVSLMKANNKPPESYLRINNLLESDEEVFSNLRDMGVEFKEDSQVPGVYEIAKGRWNLISSDLFKDGRVIIQNKGSVLVTHAMQLEPNEVVWDACAAPGMKTQLICEGIRNQGHVVASDISSTRLKTAKEMGLARSCENVDWIHADASRPPINDASKILIDAPCTSTGILRSHPSFKWRLNKATLFEIMTIQNKILNGILEAYSEKPGTEIVYATCSLLPHEGESQIDSAMSRFNIELLDIPGSGVEGYSGFACSKKVRRLFPHLHDTDGFFIARFRIVH